MENFIEYCLPYKLTVMDHFQRAFLVIMPLFLGVFSIFLLGPLGILICAALLYVAYRILVSFYYEWEYSLVEDEIIFSKIINKARRREMMKGDISKTECYGPIDNIPDQPGRVRSFLSHQGEDPNYFWITKNDRGERICILFQPTPAVLDVFAVRARGKLR